MKKRQPNIQIQVLSLCLALLLFQQCTQSNSSLHEGDLLFQDLDCGDLCNAIETVTEGVNGRDFSHCAMVVKQGNEWMVAEAIGDKVQLNSLQDFFARSGDTLEIKNIVVGRIADQYAGLLPKSIEFVKAQINKPYDDEFIADNGSYYCSELIYDAFKAANQNQAFFNLAPMTFKDPATDAFFPAWIEYYQGLGKEIPEGKPGINPGLISRSEKINIIITGTEYSFIGK
jgi:Permuted papain-like amidase enzyme, YaeF/YiiX, C92 family